MPFGGFIFGGEVVLHELNPEDEFSEHMSGMLTEGWLGVYDDDGTWSPINTELRTAHIIG